MEFEEDHHHHHHPNPKDQQDHPEIHDALSPDFENSRPPKMLTPLDVSQPSRKPRYRECLKNHAINIGGHAVDGCGEFLPAGPEGSLDALRCAACNCHRNFHRKESLIGEPLVLLSPPPIHQHPPQPQQFFPPPPYYRTQSGYLHVQQRPPLALPSTSSGGGGGGGGGGSYCREEMDEDVANAMGMGMGMGIGSSKKRLRTKFTVEQKDKMLALAERMGWRIQKQDDEAVQQFCQETGIRRHVFKVWMHNNKHTVGKKP
ncbi:zinc-finger homeodomain protein 1-like [Impatiens glandulifera]|uniref:zinc-finger homeodomain protein 1-like n=1 Tax=Impatiens glandulifera TaxID=253017 RepID=UPI001FB0934A|nr:zinc-finger homeodomain protein 1-like [Impatiens glandulifera]